MIIDIFMALGGDFFKALKSVLDFILSFVQGLDSNLLFIRFQHLLSKQFNESKGILMRLDSTYKDSENLLKAISGSVKDLKSFMDQLKEIKNSFKYA